MLRFTPARSSSRTRPTSFATARSRRASSLPTATGCSTGSRAPSAPSTTRSPTRANQVFVGNLRPEELWDVERPRWRHPARAEAARARTGVIVDQDELYRRLADGRPVPAPPASTVAEPGTARCRSSTDGEAAGAMLAAHDLDESLSASVLLENLACKTTGALALEHLLASLAPRARGRRVRDRLRRGGRRRPLPARRRQPRQGDRRAGRLRERLRLRREGVLRRARARARHRRRRSSRPASTSTSSSWPAARSPSSG